MLSLNQLWWSALWPRIKWMPLIHNSSRSYPRPPQRKYCSTVVTRAAVSNAPRNCWSVAITQRVSDLSSAVYAAAVAPSSSSSAAAAPLPTSRKQTCQSRPSWVVPCYFINTKEAHQLLSGRQNKTRHPSDWLLCKRVCCCRRRTPFEPIEPILGS